MPNFFIIGSAKSGTTALYEYLKGHPQIYMSPVKEPKFFGLAGEKLDFRGPDDEQANRTVITDIEAYQALFQGVSSEVAIGEASPWYIYIPKASKQIHSYLPEAKLIAILRNPVDRAYSNFLHQVQHNAEPLRDFTQALQEEAVRIQNNWRPFWHYKQLGFYYIQLKRYFETFNHSQIKVYLHEEFYDNPVNVLQNIFQFLEVDDTFLPDISREHNVTSIPKNRALDALLRKSNPIKSTLKSLLPATLEQYFSTNLRKINSSAKPQLMPEVRRQLIEEYREDILQLQELIQRDLSNWLTYPESQVNASAVERRQAV